MPSSWIIARSTKGDGRNKGRPRYRVLYRLGGRESRARYAGSFATKSEAVARKRWVDGELAALRVPDLAVLLEPVAAPTLRLVAARWQDSRVDVRESTAVQASDCARTRAAVLGGRPVDRIAPGDVADLVAAMHADGKARESIRKSVTALAMVLDFAGISPNPARDRVQVRLPREEASEPEPPTADTVEAVLWRLTPAYALATLVLEATGARVGELEAATVGDLDESRQAWLVRAAVSKTRRPRWILMPEDVFEAVVGRLPAREDRDPTDRLFPDVTADRLRMAIGRACRDAGIPHFAPHALRHRRISLLHRQGVSWADIGDRVGQRSKLVTADRYSHALVDYREIDRAKVLARVQAVRTPVRTSGVERPSFAGAFEPSSAHSKARWNRRAFSSWRRRVRAPSGFPSGVAPRRITPRRAEARRRSVRASPRRSPHPHVRPRTRSGPARRPPLLQRSQRRVAGLALAGLRSGVSSPRSAPRSAPRPYSSRRGGFANRLCRGCFGPVLRGHVPGMTDRSEHSRERVLRRAVRANRRLEIDRLVIPAVVAVVLVVAFGVKLLVG